MTTRRSVLRFAGAAGLLLPGLARAQGKWPERPVRLVIPYSPGGTNDIVARLYGPRLQERLGQPFMPENRPGAQAIVGTELVARARPDGHTLLLGASGPIVFNMAIGEGLPYDSLRDLQPVSMLTDSPLVMIVAAGAPFRSVAELLAWGRAHPERANYASSGAGFQLPMELLNQQSGARFQMVVYRGTADSVNAVATGECTTTLAPTAPASAAIAAGRVRALAITIRRRHPNFPEVPTMAEVGYPDATITLWSGLLAPAGTPPPIVQRLAEACAAVTQEPEIRQRLAGLALDPVGMGAEEFTREIAQQIALWSRVARNANIRLKM